MKETKNINIPPLRYFQLMELVKFYKPFTLLEVGCWNGEHGIQMSEAALSSHNSPVHYIGYDLFEDGDNLIDKKNLIVNQGRFILKYLISLENYKKNMTIDLLIHLLREIPIR